MANRRTRTSHWNWRTRAPSKRYSMQKYTHVLFKRMIWDKKTKSTLQLSVRGENGGRISARHTHKVFLSSDGVTDLSDFVRRPIRLPFPRRRPPRERFRFRVSETRRWSYRASVVAWKASARGTALADRPPPSSTSPVVARPELLPSFGLLSVSRLARTTKSSIHGQFLRFFSMF